MLAFLYIISHRAEWEEARFNMIVNVDDMEELQQINNPSLSVCWKLICDPGDNASKTVEDFAHHAMFDAYMTIDIFQAVVRFMKINASVFDLYAVMWVHPDVYKATCVMARNEETQGPIGSQNSNAKKREDKRLRQILRKKDVMCKHLCRDH